MKLEGVFEGRLYGSDGRTILQETDGGRLRTQGRLPAPTRLSERLVTDGVGNRLLSAAVGRFLTTNVWRLSADHWLASLGRTLYIAEGDGTSWTQSRRLPDSSGIRGLLPAGVCVHDGIVYLGEYPLGADANPRILRSDDYGQTWTTVVELPEVRHIHAIQVDPYTDELWVTTGDTDPQSQIGRLVDGEFQVLLSGSQQFRAVELAFTPDAVLWGVDCNYIASNDLLRLDRSEFDALDPTPEVVGSVDGSVYGAATLTVDDTQWVVFSTAAELGTDQTAPEGTTTAIRDQRVARVVAASAETGFTTWHELCAFTPASCLAALPGFDRVLPRASGYVFLATDPERGLLVNPYNSTPDDGTVVEIPHDEFRAIQTEPEALAP